MDAQELKDYIINNKKIEYVLDSLGCHGFHDNGREIRCALPNKTNKTALSIKKDSLKVKSYAASKEFSGNIFTLIMVLKECEYIGASKYLHKLLDIKYKYKSRKKDEIKESPLSIFERAKGKKTYKQDIDIFGGEQLIEYAPYPHISYIREGITKATCDKFSIGFDLRSKRIVIPHRYWAGKSDDFVGIMGRTTLENYKELGIPKYFPLKKYWKGMNLYGLNENYKDIQRIGYVTVFEAEKSVLKRDSRLDYTGTSLCSHEMTIEQVKILIGLDVPIIIAMDNDIPLYHVRSLCENFYGIRDVSYIYDKNKLVGPQDSPADATMEEYDKLFKERVSYNISEHNKYLKEKEMIEGAKKK